MKGNVWLKYFQFIFIFIYFIYLFIYLYWDVGDVTPLLHYPSTNYSAEAIQKYTDQACVQM